MNDRFKFRTWDKFCETWLTDFAINQDGEINKFFNSEEALKRRFVLMQSTGLKDINGKLIYEGDIIYSPSWWWGACFVYLDIGKCGPCKGDSVMSYILAKNIDNPLKGAIYNIWNGSEVEVIGNIYENKELLNE